MTDTPRAPRRALPRLVAAFALLFAPSAAQAEAPSITLADGKVAGLPRDGVTEYRHIPYAAPPVGPLRWRPPQPPAPWTGTLDGRAFAPACPQDEGLGAFAAPSREEDCLYLNVTVPAGAEGGKLPVLVWVPGGGFFAGSAADYDTAALAREGMIVVTFNYRVGILGFLAHPALDGEGHAFADYGLMDQQAALRWVQGNIARFGGDPANVTLAGQSAGGSSVLHNLVSPGARGLFHKGLSLSGLVPRVTPLERARMLGAGFAAAAGCAEGDAAGQAACLRTLPVDEVLARQRGFLSAVIVDGTVLPEQPAAALASGTYAHLPLVTGAVAREQAFALAAREMTGPPVGADDVRRDVALFVSRDHAGEILAAYPLADYPSPSEADIAAIQGARACTSRWIAGALAARAPVFAYEFDADAPPSYFPPTSFAMGAYHTAELQYLFPLFRGGLGTAHPLDAEQQALSREMLGFVGNFVRSGDPNGSGLRPWPRYDAASDTLVAFGSGGLLSGYGARNRCGFWQPILGFEQPGG